MARALSFTLDGAWPSAQLIEPSALELLAAVRDHFQKDMVVSSIAIGVDQAAMSSHCRA
jgi:hypothetical protein